jgi:hypothetical protein
MSMTAQRGALYLVTMLLLLGGVLAGPAAAEHDDECFDPDSSAADIDEGMEADTSPPTVCPSTSGGSIAGTTGSGGTRADTGGAGAVPTRIDAGAGGAAAGTGPASAVAVTALVGLGLEALRRRRR